MEQREDQTFAHPLEVLLARGLRDACRNVRVGCDISQSDAFATVTSALEGYLPSVLGEVHASWKHESLDGVFHELAIKTAECQAQIAGLCILISDQTLTPYHVQLRHALNADEIEWLDCRLGEQRDDEMVRIPYGSIWGKWSVAERLDTIRWKFHVGFGDPEVTR
jgi:hypothetical protein